ncbi:MAG: hypothetical protein JSW02_01265 [candidate division WOR-3 bacterium]|nr:MAG: hypothetical protein JSW02_01265 [candidate division WOR-3 bacterium]
MRYAKLFIAVLFIGTLLLHCGGPSEAMEYTHSRAGFKITIPAGWTKISEDNEMFEFRSGDLKLIEVGGFDLELTMDELSGITDAEVAEWIEESTHEGLEGYCDEARIVGYTIQKEGPMTWGGLPAYSVQIRGYSEEADKTMIVDLIAAMSIETGYMYMFASQIAESMYQDVRSGLDAAITSFKLTQ